MWFFRYKVNMCNKVVLGGIRLTSKKITSTMINADKYADFIINTQKNADSMFNKENL